MMSRFRYRLLAVLFALALFFSFAPTAHAASGRSIDVNISTQTITAYEGNTAVYSAGVTTGRPGFETPTGTFSIVNRVYNETMDSSTIGIPRDGPGGYYITGILFTQYFDNSGDALHYNYWSPDSAFGSYPTSHGCVGMQYGPAQFFWDFATYGTPVIVHY